MSFVQFGHAPSEIVLGRCPSQLFKEAADEASRIFTRTHIFPRTMLPVLLAVPAIALGGLTAVVGVPVLLFGVLTAVVGAPAILFGVLVGAPAILLGVLPVLLGSLAILPGALVTGYRSLTNLYHVLAALYRVLAALCGALTACYRLLTARYGERGSESAQNLIKAAKVQYKDRATQIAAFQRTLTEAVTATNALLGDVVAYMVQDTPREEREAIHARIKEEFGRMMERVVEEMRTQFPPLDRAPTHEEREQRVDYALARVNAAVGDMFRRLGIAEVHAESLMRSVTALGANMKKMIVIVGDLGEQYPQLSKILLTSAATIFGIPQAWILRILLKRFGFRPMGLVRGYAAARAQRFIFGSLIAQGGWFEILGTLLLY